MPWVGVRKGLRSALPRDPPEAASCADAATARHARSAVRPARRARHRPPHPCAPPVFTVAEAVALRGALPGGHTKNLFLKDKKGGLWLAVMLEERRTDLKLLADALGAPRFSFGNGELLAEMLGVRPGSVTPFALINDSAHHVAVVLDRAMLAIDPLNFHPLEKRPHDGDRAGRSVALSSPIAGTRRASSTSIRSNRASPDRATGLRHPARPNLVLSAACRHVWVNPGEASRWRTRL